MKRNSPKQFKLLSMVFFHLFLLSVCVWSASQIEQVQQAIAAHGAKWTAEENWVTRLSPEERQRLCGTIIDPPNPATTTPLALPIFENLPEKFDWRDNSGNWVTPVRNQGNCGSCWAFSVAGQIEAWWNIKFGTPGKNIDLSEQYLLSCSNGSCNGGSIAATLEFIRQRGIPREDCFPYKEDDTIPCSQVCPNWQQEAISFPGWGYVTLEEAIVENIKSAVYRHPVSAAYIVYEDFNFYAGGVYEYVWGEVEAGHAILIVGWNDAEQSWICKNSWGPNWGDNGYFRIKWGQCEIGQNIAFIWDDVIVQPSLSANPDELEFTMTVGDSLNESITLTNNSNQDLEYATIDYGSRVIFHQSDFNSFDGLSWWCGDPVIKGYAQHWLQYLDTPPINLSNTTVPLLSWMGFWAIENPASAEPPWDGWDGCNVWVSVDGGQNFTVATPIQPQYDCQSMWSFGEPEQGWDMGTGIAGWAGMSDGWVPVDFDLSPYKADSVIIRFAFASDMGHDTKDEAALIGFFVDEIVVTDGADTLFEEDGDGFHTMQRVSPGAIPEANWISVLNGTGIIPPNASTEIELMLNTSQMILGNYQGLLQINSNENSLSPLQIPFQLKLNAADYDLHVENVWFPGESLPILFPVELGARIRNVGLENALDFAVVCYAYKDDMLAFADTVQVDFLKSGASTLIKFDDFTALYSGSFDFQIQITDFPDDYNLTNNFYRSQTEVSNLIDGFESETGFWEFEGGWAITDQFGGHQGDWAVNVAGDRTAYDNNMDATMTFQPGFLLGAVDRASLKFWTMYFTEPDRDVCSIEVSYDQENWQSMMDISGNGLFWKQHTLDLTPFIREDSATVWVRFHFVSDAENPKICFLVDDVEIYINEPVTSIDYPSTSPVAQWQLTQNYPNPFNMHTTINYHLLHAENVSLQIYNVQGQLVRELVNRFQTAGAYHIAWNGCDETGNPVGSGIYFYKLKAGDAFMETKKLILMK